MAKEKRKFKKQSTLNGFVSVQKEVELASGKKVKVSLDGSHAAVTPQRAKSFTCACGRSDFKTIQGLRGHEAVCPSAKALKEKREIELSSSRNANTLFSTTSSRARRTSTTQERSATLVNPQRETTATNEKIDGRIDNRGSAVRNSWTVIEKLELLDTVNEALDSGEARDVADYFRNVKQLGNVEADRMSNRYYRWNKDYKNILNAVMNEGLKKNSKKKRMRKRTKSPFHEVETELYKRFVERRKNSQKVSARWIRVNGVKIFNDMKQQDPEKWGEVRFKGSYGWMRRFIKRKNIKFRKRKCGKEKTAQECVTEFEAFLHKLRFQFLKPREEDEDAVKTSIWGRFPPECRYNMDQVPLPFVNGQDDTFTTEDDNDVNIKCPRESLRKRQFTMHLVFNAGSGDKAQGWCDLVCKGTGKRINSAEKELWDEDVKIFWQDKAWVDKHVMRELARRFVKHKLKVHGATTWVILFCDNLSAHLDEEVKKIFGDARVFLCFLPPGMTNFIQAIDAGLGRSVRLAIGRHLDEWLMDELNLRRWEDAMPASERRILTTKLVALAMSETMDTSKDSVRVGCFERTGLLMTHTPIPAHDSKIRPQGMKRGTFSIPTVELTASESNTTETTTTSNTNNMTDEEVVMQEEDAVIEEMNNEFEYVVTGENELNIEDV